MTGDKYPTDFFSIPPKSFQKPKVKLTNTDGNALVLIGQVTHALRKAGMSREDIARFQKEAMSGDYNKVLTTCCEWADVS